LQSCQILFFYTRFSFEKQPIKSIPLDSTNTKVMKLILLLAVLPLLFANACGVSSSKGSPGETVEKAYNCIGTEPFWNVKIEKAGITYHRMGEEPEVFPYQAAKKQGAGSVYETTVKGRRLVVAITPGECSDGMSDTSYPYSVQVEIDGETLRGCAFLLGQNPMREGK
jgi:uncharacterized membrane protein